MKSKFFEFYEKEGLYQTDHSVVVINFSQDKGTHAVIIAPKRSVTSLLELSKNERKDLFLTTKHVIDVFEQNIPGFQYIFLFNIGKYAGQSIGDIHFHILQMKSGNGLEKIEIPNPSIKQFNQDEINEFQELGYMPDTISLANTEIYNFLIPRTACMVTSLTDLEECDYLRLFETATACVEDFEQRKPEGQYNLLFDSNIGSRIVPHSNAYVPYLRFIERFPKNGVKPLFRRYMEKYTPEQLSALKKIFS